MQSKRLLPCPFCGGNPSIIADPNHSTAVDIMCPNGGCPVEPSVWDVNEVNAIRRWNTRANADG
ncbi:Lar family restriction alleviation protein [Hyphomicrobium sp. DMF-1]|uniref:Lar family restriction alleviation protein n=1 Tax=Hyphomicrobium sp. DMF-1 TaxID=3019544 RepID=UPI0022EBFC34|nr:Lar family restriction alleviation protein [Hyphomicrobium sp. DMF-1]WBT40125.1 Lar family restriction alleviation protein [Hyphomicrobium sp. DMF-1]